MRTTIKDVAKAANIHPTVVSAVLNGSKTVRVSPATRERVLHCVQTMNYRPSSAARGLAGVRSHAVGVLMSSTHDPFSAEMTAQFQTRLKQANCMGIFGYWNDIDGVTEALRTVTNYPLDGVILLTDGVVELPTGLPVALFAQQTPKCYCIEMDYRKTMTQILAHLHELGHRSVGFLGMRQEAYCQHYLELAPQYDFELRDEWNVHCTGYYENAYPEALKFLALPEKPTALICRNDSIGIAVCNAALRLGIRIPDELSVVGRDGIGEERKAYPELTTVRIPVDMLIDKLVTAILERRSEGFELLETQLIVGESSGIAPR